LSLLTPPPFPSGSRKFLLLLSKQIEAAFISTVWRKCFQMNIGLRYGIVFIFFVFFFPMGSSLLGSFFSSLLTENGSSGCGLPPSPFFPSPNIVKLKFLFETGPRLSRSCSRVGAESRRKRSDSDPQKLDLHHKKIAVFFSTSPHSHPDLSPATFTIAGPFFFQPSIPRFPPVVITMRRWAQLYNTTVFL